jgi:hypothetical protein
MSTGIGRKIVVAVATLLISSLATQASAEGPCSAASLQGSYAFRIEGTNVSNPYLPLGPFAAVGRNTYDGQGGMRGVIVVNSNGAKIPTSYHGTYTLTRNCTGSKSAALAIGLTVNFDFVVDSNLHGIEMIVTQAGPANALTDGLTISGSARKQFAATANKD